MNGAQRMPEDFRGGETRTRLLEAASEVFVEAGYNRATLREICRRAGANNAAINYHFHDKESLYTAVVRRELDPTRAYMPQWVFPADLPPEQKLRGFVRSILTALLGSSRPARLMKLMARELSEPTAALDLVIDEVVRPLNAALHAILREILGPDASDQLVADCGRSIMAQCVVYDNSRAVVMRLGHYTEYDEPTIAHLAEHILAFSLPGLRALAGKPNL
jgi:AcrR family transcriptional regulator